jgi:hypothetical protein
MAALLHGSGMFALAVEQRVRRHLADDDFSPLHKTALLLTGHFGLLHRTRLACVIAGAVFLPGLLAVQFAMTAHNASSFAWLACQAVAVFVLCLAGSLMERRLFFTAVQPVKMPGAIAS